MQAEVSTSDYPGKKKPSLVLELCWARCCKNDLVFHHEKKLILTNKEAVI